MKNKVWARMLMKEEEEKKGEADEKEEQDYEEEENWRRKTAGQGRPAGVLNFKQNSILTLTNHITSRLGPNLIIVIRVAI